MVLMVSNLTSSTHFLLLAKKENGQLCRVSSVCITRMARFWQDWQIATKILAYIYIYIFSIIAQISLDLLSFIIPFTTVMWLHNSGYRTPCHFRHE